MHAVCRSRLELFAVEQAAVIVDHHVSMSRGRVQLRVAAQIRLQRRRAGLAEADVENAFDHLGRNPFHPGGRRG